MYHGEDNYCWKWVWGVGHPVNHCAITAADAFSPIQFLFRGFGANFVTLLLTTQLQILLHFGVNTSKTCLPVQLYKLNPKIVVLNFLTLKTKPASSSIIKEEEKEEGEDVESNEDEKDEKEEELQSNAEDKEEEELQSNDEEGEEASYNPMKKKKTRKRYNPMKFKGPLPLFVHHKCFHM
jgi:hypothetical protein